jgi:hypothetical protein
MQLRGDCVEGKYLWRKVSFTNLTELMSTSGGSLKSKEVMQFTLPVAELKSSCPIDVSGGV